MVKKIIMAGTAALLAGIIFFPWLAHGQNLKCDMPYKKLLCQLRTDGNASAVSCLRNGEPFVSYQCTLDGSGWRCLNKEGRGGSVMQMSQADFQNDVIRCDRLCDFCVYDWQPDQVQQKTDGRAMNRDGKKCKTISKCVEEVEIEVTKYRNKCESLSFAKAETCSEEPYQVKQMRCLRYEDKEVCE